MKGVNTDGFFAEYTTVDAATAVVIPETSTATPAQLSPIFCAGITVWDALSRAEVRPGETVAIVGIGGLGEIATKYAQAIGGKVFAIDIHDGQLEGVKVGGSADEILNTRGMEVAEVRNRVRELNQGRGVDAVVVTSGSKAAYLTAMMILRPEGRLMAVGIPPEHVPVNMALVATLALKYVDYFHLFRPAVMVMVSAAVLTLIGLLGRRSPARLALQLVLISASARGFILKCIRGSSSWRISMK